MTTYTVLLYFYVEYNGQCCFETYCTYLIYVCIYQTVKQTSNLLYNEQQLAVCFQQLSLLLFPVAHGVDWVEHGKHWSCDVNKV